MRCELNATPAGSGRVATGEVPMRIGAGPVDGGALPANTPPPNGGGGWRPNGRRERETLKAI